MSDAKAHIGGLCPPCTRYGQKTWDDFGVVIDRLDCCGELFLYVSAKTRHTCKVKRPPAIVQSSSALASGLGMRDDTIDIVSVTIVDATEAPPPQMGYALTSRRATIAVDAHVGARLQELFELGNVNVGQKLSTFAMEEKCKAEFPWTLVPDRNRIGSWLTSEVHKHKRRRID